jgi:hypothetical protein
MFSWEKFGGVQGDKAKTKKLLAIGAFPTEVGIQPGRCQHSP